MELFTLVVDVVIACISYESFRKKGNSEAKSLAFTMLIMLAVRIVPNILFNALYGFGGY